MRLFSTEQVSKYHPDKYADQISDAILDECLRKDKNSRVACETMVKGKTVLLAGEITTSAKIDYAGIAQRVGEKLGYKVVNVTTYITEQSSEIAGGVKEGELQGAGDQGVMFGYATNETPEMLPYGFAIANRIIKIIEKDVDFNKKTILKGDAKCQVTVDIDEKQKENSIKKILISTCHKEDISKKELESYILKLLSIAEDRKYIPYVSKVDIIINPAGEWTIGGPIADCGLTGRKIVCDQYGGYTPVGGGAFSGKDPSKVDRSAAYMARILACDVVKNHGADWAEVQLAYAIGQAQPMSVNVKTDKGRKFDQRAAKWIIANYDLTPHGIIKYLDLMNIKYERLAEGCHFREGMWSK